MPTREAMIQAHVELGASREDAELRANFSDGVVPGGAALSQCPVKPRQEGAFIDAMKMFFRKLNATPGAWEALQAEIAKQSRKN